MTGVFPIVLEANNGVAAMLLSAERYGLGTDYIDTVSKKYEMVTIEAVNAATAKYLLPEHAVTIVCGELPEND